MADTNLIYPYELEGGKKAVANEVMANFEAIQLVVAGLNTEINNLTTVLTDLKKKPTREMMDIYYSFSGQAPTGAFPLWTGETLNNAKTLYPQFWKKLNQLADDGAVPTVASNEEYEEKLEKYGQCASFYINTLDGHIRLPKITRFISSIEQLTDIGEYEDSNKAHTHGVKVSSDGSKTGTDTQEGYLARGFTKYSSPWSKNNNNGVNEVLITSEGDEAQPKHIRLYLYLQVVNNTAEISEFNLNAITEQMNKALEKLESAYSTYLTSLQDAYKNIQENILNSKPVIRGDDVISVFHDNDGETYKYYADIIDSDITSNMFISVSFDLENATSGNFAPVVDAFDGYFRVYAKEVPTQPVTIEYIAQ